MQVSYRIIRGNRGRLVFFNTPELEVRRLSTELKVSEDIPSFCVEADLLLHRSEGDYFILGPFGADDFFVVGSNDGYFSIKVFY